MLIICTLLGRQNDSLNRTHELLQSNGLTARAYGLAENIVKTGYGYAQPVLGYGPAACSPAHCHLADLDPCA